MVHVHSRRHFEGDHRHVVPSELGLLSGDEFPHVEGNERHDLVALLIVVAAAAFRIPLGFPLSCFQCVACCSWCGLVPSIV